MKKRVVFIILLIMLMSSVSAKDYTVTQSGSGADLSVEDFNGLSGTGYAGDTFYFSGSFNTRIEVYIEGTPGLPVILDGYQDGNCDPIHDCDEGDFTCDGNTALAADLKQGMTVGDGKAGPDHITIQDFRMTYPGYNTNSLNIYPDRDDPSSDMQYSDYITVQRNFVYNSGATMFLLYNSRNSIIEDNKFFVYSQNPGSNPPRGFVTQLVSDTIIRGNEIGHDDNRYPGYASSAEMFEIHKCHHLLIEYNDVYGAVSQSGIRPKEQSPGNNNIIIRYNKIHDNNNVQSRSDNAGIHLNTDSASPQSYFYIYGNLIYDNHAAGILIGQYVNHIYIWSNIIFSNDRNGIATWSSSDTEYFYIYNNILARNGDKEESDTNRGGIVLPHGSNVYVKNNILWNNRPGGVGGKYNQFYSSITPSALEHDTYYHSGSTPTFYYNGDFRTLSYIQSQGFEDDAPVGEIKDYGFNDPIGDDGIYGTEDDDYTLNGNNFDDGSDIDQCFDLTVQGQNYHMCYRDALHPSTDWSAFPSPSTIITTSQNDHGSGWERGAYVYADGQPQDTCFSSGGSCCTGSQTCPGTSLGTYSDCSGTCCSVDCQTPTGDSCQSLGYNCCSECEPGTEQTTYDGDCSGVCCSSCKTSTFIPVETVEAEDGTITPPMQVGNDASASGGSFIYTLTSDQGSAEFTFDITTPGEYIIEASIIAPDEGQDSFFVGLDGENTQGVDTNIWDTIETDTWTWVNVSRRGSGTPEVNEFDPMIWTLSTGQHTFTIYGREGNTKLDQIILKRIINSQCGPADLPTRDNVVDIGELSNYINRWKNGEVGISEIMEAIGEWKNGC